MTQEELVRKIVSKISRLDEEVESIATASQKRYKEMMKPDAVVPRFRPYQAADKDAEEEVKSRQNACIEEIANTIRSIEATSRAARTAPASADEVATVQLALSRKYITHDELSELYDRYKHNYQLAQAISDRAEESGWYIGGAKGNAYPEDAISKANQLIRNRYRVGAPMPVGVVASAIAGELYHIDAISQVATW